MVENHSLKERKIKSAKIKQMLEILTINMTKLAFTFTDYESEQIKKLINKEETEY